MPKKVASPRGRLAQHKAASSFDCRKKNKTAVGESPIENPRGGSDSTARSSDESSSARGRADGGGDKSSTEVGSGSEVSPCSQVGSESSGGGRVWDYLRQLAEVSLSSVKAYLSVSSPAPILCDNALEAPVTCAKPSAKSPGRYHAGRKTKRAAKLASTPRDTTPTVVGGTSSAAPAALSSEHKPGVLTVVADKDGKKGDLTPNGRVGEGTAGEERMSVPAIKKKKKTEVATQVVSPAVEMPTIISPKAAEGRPTLPRTTKNRVTTAAAPPTTATVSSRGRNVPTAVAPPPTEKPMATAKQQAAVTDGASKSKSPNVFVKTSACKEEVTGAQTTPKKPQPKRNISAQSNREVATVKQKTTEELKEKEDTPRPLVGPIKAPSPCATTVERPTDIAIPPMMVPAHPPGGAAVEAGAPAASNGGGSKSLANDTPSPAKEKPTRTSPSKWPSCLSDGESAIPLVAAEAKTLLFEGGVSDLTSSAEDKPNSSSTTTSESITPIPTVVVTPSEPVVMRTATTGSPANNPPAAPGATTSTDGCIASIGPPLSDGELWPSLLQGAEHKAKRKPTGASPVSPLGYHPTKQDEAGRDDVVLTEVIEGLNCMREQLDQLMDRPERRNVASKAELERLRRQIAQNEATAKRLAGRLRQRSTEAGPRDDAASGCWRTFPKRQQRNKSTTAHHNHLAEKQPFFSVDVAADVSCTGPSAVVGGAEGLWRQGLFRHADGTSSNMFAPGCELTGEMSGGATVGLTREATLSVLSAIDNTADPGGSQEDQAIPPCTGETYFFYDSSEKAWIQVMLPPCNEV
eukprot:GHVS01064107.1.p1 GENE.GHVS01064107.1~~GHVS01064107.1.p1  ORF type:complete len:803 (-),score=170.98 GHVS01064107.1:145-2553(-)